jgi:glycosyltransferase involved in cell wall biosynthesis
MRILYVGTLPPHPGGSAISGSQIVLGLAARGHQVRAIAPIEARVARGGDSFARRHPEIEIHRFEVAASLTTPYVSPEGRPEGEWACGLLRELLRRDRPDVVMLGREGYAFGCIELAREASVPVVLRVAGGTLAGIVSGAYAATGACVRPGRSPLRWDHAWLEAVAPADLLVTPAHYMGATLERLGLERVLVIPNAIDLSQFSANGEADGSPRLAVTEMRRRLGVEDGDVVIASVANLNTRKRPLDVIASAALALRRDPRLLFVLAGEGSLRPQVEQACRVAGIEDRVRVLGWIEYDQIPGLMGLADVVVLASDGEGLARASLEALATGKVLIITDIPPSREVVSDGHNGFLFQVGDVDRLAALTVEAAADPQLRHRIGRAAAESVASRSLEDAVASYERELFKVIDDSRSGSRDYASLF